MNPGVVDHRVVGDAAGFGETGADAGDGLLDGEDDLGGAADGVSVTLDTIAQPGTMISGKAKFSDGESATWYVDQMGQLGLDTTTPGYQPSPEDLAMFQQELSKAASQAGF